MIFMDIVTWDPKDNDTVHQRYEAWVVPEGYNIISEWFDLSSCRFFTIYELENEEAYARSAFPFRDITKLETIPVIKPEKAFEIAEKMMAEMEND
ncbi:MAG: DUF3303 family protein [Methanolobus sp.]